MVTTMRLKPHMNTLIAMHHICKQSDREESFENFKGIL